MRNKELVINKIEQLENLIKSIDRLYRVSSTAYEKEQVYTRIVEQIESIKTLINTEFQD